MKKLLMCLTLMMILSFSLQISAQEIMTAESAGNFLHSKGLIQGDNGNLMLDEFLTREQIIVLMSRFIGAEETAKNYHTDLMTFKDVSEDHWAAPYIAWAQANRLTNGYNEEQFGLGDYATGWQTKAFFVKALGYVNVADEEMETKAEQLGITLNINVDSSQPILRGQMSMLLYNALNAINIDGDLFGERLGMITPVNKSNIRDGQWIYYVNNSDENKLYKMDLTGNNEAKLTDDSVYGLTIDGNWIYYYNKLDEGKLYRVTKNGLSRTKILDDIVSGPVIYKDWIYYSNVSQGSLLYKVMTSGKSNTKLTEDNCGGISLIGDWVYYINFRDNASLYKVKTDGTGRTRVDENKSLVLNENGSSYNFLNSNSVIIGDWTYYSNPSSNHYLYKVNSNGTENIKLNEAYTKNIYNIGDWIYYENYSDQSKVYKISLDGTKNIKISDERVNILDINQSNIYFRSLNDNKFYKMGLDGKGIGLISDDMVIDAKVDKNWIYYINYNDAGKIYKIKNNGTQKAKVYNKSAFGLYLTEGFLYFSQVEDDYKVYKLNLRNLSDERVTHEGSLIIQETDEMLYYYNLLDNDNIYKISVDGTNKIILE